MNQGADRTVLITAFEPSGDRLGASLVRALREREVPVRVVAYGGELLRESGAEVVEDTCSNPVMGIPSLRVIREHMALNKRIGATMDDLVSGGGLDLHLAVDSPAANFPACKLAGARGVGVMHMAAPQLWAWAPWRIRKLRRLTDHLMCLLPFEREWFASRGVRATFIGHPVFDEPMDTDVLEALTSEYPESEMRVALLPGSRAKEHQHNFPIQLETFRRLRADHPELMGMVAAVDETGAHRLQQIANASGGWPEGLEMRVGEVEAILHWADVCLTVSGTVTLQVLRHAVPMVVHFRTSRLLYHGLARWLLTPDFFSLPNLIAGSRIVTELMPYFGDATRLTDEARQLIEDGASRERMRDALIEARRQFENTNASESACELVLQQLELQRNGPGGT
ncbi:MAG: lipid-A-disaccharide synthase [Phycisphaerales bacterium JB043]